ncbi:hypothetical protein V8C86DRAFT_3036383 [Haematococcus lacustris]
MTDSSDGQPPTDQGSGVTQGGPRPPQPSLRPHQALAQLELELMAVCEDERQGVDRLREMLQRECDEVAAARKLSAARRQAEGAGVGADPVARAGAGGGYGRHLKLEGLQPDPGAGVDTSDFGKERLPHHADTELAGLLPEQHLRAGRHGEWAPLSLPDSQTRLAGHAGNWGVTISPPGMERTGVNAEELEGLMKAIRQQQWR